MATTTLGNILNITLNFASSGTIAQMQLSEPGTITIKFDNKKSYLDAGNQHFPFKRPKYSTPEVRK